jgi:hypothetical protein
MSKYLPSLAVVKDHLIWLHIQHEPTPSLHQLLAVVWWQSRAQNSLRVIA